MEEVLSVNEEEVKVSEEVSKEQENSEKTTQEIVEHYFSDIPVLIDVASCESEFRQFNKNGSVLRGTENSSDVGVMQINEKYHLQVAQRLGIDIYTLEGNMEYARFLYNSEGTRPWKYSSFCWNKMREVAVK